MAGSTPALCILWVAVIEPCGDFRRKSARSCGEHSGRPNPAKVSGRKTPQGIAQASGTQLSGAALRNELLDFTLRCGAVPPQEACPSSSDLGKGKAPGYGTRPHRIRRRIHRLDLKRRVTDEERPGVVTLAVRPSPPRRSASRRQRALGDQWGDNTSRWALSKTVL